MRIAIKLGNGEEKSVEIHVKQRHVDIYLDKIEALKKKVDEKKGSEIMATRDFLNFENELALECSSISKEEYEDADVDERSKITSAIRAAAFPQSNGDPSLFFPN